MTAARLIFRRRPVENFAAAFSNAAFMGFPLISAVLGDEALLYAVPFTILLNLLQWTYGRRILSDEGKGTDIRSIILNPIMLSALAGLLIFLLNLGTAVPSVLSTALGGISGMNTPLAMIVLGTYPGKGKLSSLFTRGGLYCVSAVRLLLIPALSVFVLLFLPVGANTAVYAQLCGRDYAYAGQTVVLSTLFSLLTLPFVVMLGGICF